MSVELEASAVIGEDSVAEPTEVIEEQEETTNNNNDDSEQDNEDERDDSEDQEDDSEEESEGEDEPEVDEPAKKLTAQERIQQLANEKRALAEKQAESDRKLAELEAKVNEQLKREQENKQDFDLGFTKDVLNDKLAEIEEAIEDAKSMKDFVAVTTLRKQQDKIIADFDANADKIFKWHESKEASKTHETQVADLIHRVEVAAETYRAKHNISEQLWQEGGIWFANECRADPVLGEKYNELVMTRGPIWAIEWAHKHTVENMGKKAAEVKQKKEEAKKKLVGGVSSSASSNANTPKTFDELMNMSEADIIKFEETNPKMFTKLINDKIKRR